ncbi:MAG: hypothetical protein N2C12_04510, partial [Planctomycetales bacterium]
LIRTASTNPKPTHHRWASFGLVFEICSKTLRDFAKKLDRVEGIFQVPFGMHRDGHFFEMSVSACFR